MSSLNSGTIAMSIKSGSPQSAFNSGTLTENVSSGVATFPNLVVHTAGSYTLTATPSGITGVTAVNSSAFTVSANTATAAISVSSGSSQSATVATAFASPLTALVQDTYNNPISGVSVTFAAPTSGASGTFASGGNCTSNPQTYECVATTNSSGIATSSTYTANTIAGSELHRHRDRLRRRHAGKLHRDERVEHRQQARLHYCAHG